MVIVVMGVAGSGKTVIGSALAKSLGWEFADADSFHPPANVEKMSLGHPLTDEDRWPWLEAVANAMDAWIAHGVNGVMACSALKQAYRDVLDKKNPEQVKIAYLKGSFELFLQRLSHRENHFMKSNMLKSQFETLEEPEGGIVVDAALPPDEIVDQLVEQIKQKI